MQENDTSQQTKGCFDFTKPQWIGITIFAIIFSVWSSSQGSDDETAEVETVRMEGVVTVYDQRACADGPILRIRAGAYGFLPIEYPASNAPCRLAIDHDVDEASQYRFEVKPLPPVVRTIEALQSPGGTLDVDIRLLP